MYLPTTTRIAIPDFALFHGNAGVFFARAEIEKEKAILAFLSFVDDLFISEDEKENQQGVQQWPFPM
jgi:hypothetical protein